MKPPFELPVKAETSIVDSDSRYITTETHTIFVAIYLQKNMPITSSLP